MNNKYIKFINDANSLCAIKGIKADRKSLLSITLLDLCNEHVISISHLLNLKFHASAMALLRSAVEALVRGLWVSNCSDISQTIRLSKSDGVWPKFEAMAQEVNSTFDNKPLLGRYMGRTYGLMNSFTHGLSHQILARFDGKEMSFSLAAEQLSSLYAELALLSFRSNLAIAAIADDQIKIDKLHSLWAESEI